MSDLSYNVGLTRFLNPDDNEDAEYLVGLPQAEPGTEYLGVFLTIENETEDQLPSAPAYTVDSESPYALDIAAEVPGEGELPLPDTTAATGPNHGSLLIFLVDDEVSENRPLRLAVEGGESTGEVVLDI